MREYKVDGLTVAFDWNVNAKVRGIYTPKESEQDEFESVALSAIKSAADKSDLDTLAGDAENAMREHALNQYPEDEDWSPEVQAIDCNVIISND